MSWKDFKEALAANNLNQAQFSELSGYSEQVISKWQHRVNGVPRWVATWLRLYRGGKGKITAKV